MDKKREQGWFPCILFFGFLVYAVVSWVIEEKSGENLWILISHGKWYSSLTTSKAAYEVIKLIGLCSFVVGWIYNKWDKLSYGLTFGTYIEHEYKNYKCMSVFQIIATLFCLAAASAEICECAWALLFAVLSGLSYQWSVLRHMILTDKSRKELAPNLWKAKMNNANSKSDNPNDNSKEKWHTVFYLTTQFVNADEIEKDIYLQCLADCLMDISDETNNRTKALMRFSIQQMISMWEKTLGNLSDYDLVRYSTAFFEKIPQENPCILSLGAAFTAFLLMRQQSDDNPNNQDNAPLYQCLDIIRNFNSGIDQRYDILKNETQYLFSTVCWMLQDPLGTAVQLNANINEDLINETILIILEDLGVEMRREIISV